VNFTSLTAVRFDQIFLMIMLGGADAMPAEKREFTYKQFMPKIMLRCATSRHPDGP
jgi:hypothetical protein